MKVNKLITIDYELMIELQKEDNASGLINSMLTKHYKDSNKTDEQIIQDVKDLIKKKKEKEALHDKYNNPKHITKRKKEMEAIRSKKYAG